jgi:hypothetical protein
MYAYCREMPGVTKEMATKVERQIGDDPVAGLVAHVSGPTEVGWRIIDVWESEEDFQRFQVERLMPALQIATQNTTPPRRPFDVYAVHGLEGQTRLGARI